MGRLQSKSDWIIFDTPPLLPVTDALVLGRECMGLVMVVRMGCTHVKLIERAQALLAEAQLPILGCILNDFVATSRHHAYYHQYYDRRGSKKNGKK